MQKFRRTILAVFICIKLAHYPYRHNCFFYFFFFFSVPRRVERVEEEGCSYSGPQVELGKKGLIHWKK